MKVHCAENKYYNYSGFSARQEKNTWSNCLRQVNFALGQEKMEVWWSGGQVKLAPVVLLVDKT